MGEPGTPPDADALEQLRAHVIADVRAIEPVDPREADSKVETLAGLEQLTDPFSEIADPTHVTGSCLIVGPRGIVILRHRRLGIWVQPGGHVDPGETPWEAALREGVEETGLELRHPHAGPLLVHVDAHDGGRGHRHLDLRYALLGEDRDPKPPAGESQECRWFGFAQATAIADDGLRGALPAARALAQHLSS